MDYQGTHRTFAGNCFLGPTSYMYISALDGSNYQCRNRKLLCFIYYLTRTIMA